MTEKKQCRWGLLMRQASVLGRFKNKLRLKKLEWKRFYEQMWGPPPPIPETEFEEWVESNHGTEGSTASNYNSQYFDSLSAEEFFDLFQQGQIGMAPTVPSRFHQELGMWGQQCEEQSQPMLLDSHHGQQQHQQPQWMDHMDSFDSTPPLSVSEYLDSENTDEFTDTFSEWRQLEDQMRVQANSSSQLEPQSMGSAMSIDMVGNVDMKDTGDSSTLPLRPEDRLQWFKQFFEVGAEEALTGPRHGSTGRGWRVVVRIVCACRKLSKMLRRRKMEKNPPSQAVVKKKHRGFGENRSQLYKGVRRRNGKWVSEIRIGRTNEKVWLGSYDTEKEAALAFDAGKYHCSAKKCRSFNFPNSPRLLGPPINLRDLCPKDRKKTIQRLAEDHAKTLLELNPASEITRIPMDSDPDEAARGCVIGKYPSVLSTKPF